jgi:peptidoglycan/LPS O-acetylase OafA/YrhL
LNHADRLPGLDLLRCIAILWVMAFHSFVVGGLGPDWSWLSRYGWMGVDLFFVLSGFLIGTQVLVPLARGQGLSLTDFYWRRALRILPAYWAVLALYTIWPNFREALGMEPCWKFLAFVMNLSIDYSRNVAFSHAWSLCVEEHFYWFFPLLCLALSPRLTTRKFLALCCAVVLAGIALRATIWLHDANAVPSLSRNWFIEDIYYPTWNRLDGLLCGVALAAWKAFHPQAWQRARSYANASFIGGLVLLWLAISLFENRVGLLGNTIGWPVLSAALGLLVFAGAGRDSLIGRSELPLAAWIAAISYGLYLVHKAIYHVVQANWGTQLKDQGFFAFFVYGAAAILAGATLHYAVERPFLQLRRQWAGKPRPALTADAA